VLGYWIGVPYWGNGYATEAGRAVLDHGFGELGLNRVYAHCFARNPASRRVLEKLGMRHEGTRRRHTLKWGEYLDEEEFGILASDR
jgi:RimJ/RimL family protein N-acetyltransferase